MSALEMAAATLYSYIVDVELESLDQIIEDEDTLRDLLGYFIQTIQEATDAR